MKSVISPEFTRKALALIASGLICTAAPVQAAFHLWSLREVYSDASGTLQFIELTDNFGSEQFVGGTTFQLSNIGSSITHSFIFPNSLPSESFGHTMLLGTAGLQAAGGPAPDFIIPNNFIFAAGGSISYFNASGSYTALPTDGTFSRVWGDGNAVNSPQNFAGQIGFVVVPEPACGCLLLCGGLFFGARRRFAP